MGRRKFKHYDGATKARAIELVLAGDSCTAAAEKIGVNHDTVRRWCVAAGLPLRTGRKGGVMLTLVEAAESGPRESPRARLSIEDRVRIQDGLAARKSIREIARIVGVDHSTVSREVRAHRGPDGRYSARLAQSQAEAARRRPRATKLERDPRLRAYVVGGLDRGWSPEQICARMRLDHPGDDGMRLSHETVYRALYVQGRGSLREELSCEQALRSGRRGRKPRSKLPERRGAKRWVEGHEIARRPAEADDRAVPGHWEGDLVVGGDLRSCLITLVERSSRALLMSRLGVHDSDTVVDRLRELAPTIPEALSRTLTWDQGVEMAASARFADATSFEVYFCDPHSPWQRPSNENTNGLIRQYFPKGTDFTEVTDEEVARVQDLLNGRPRKSLGWRTPAEALASELEVVQS